MPDKLIITELAVGGGFFFFGGIMLRQLFKRVDTLDAKKVDKEQFKKVEETLATNTKVLSTQETHIAVIAERVKFLAEKNGYKKKDD